MQGLLIVVGFVLLTVGSVVVSDVLNVRRRNRVLAARRQARIERELSDLRYRERVMLDALRGFGPMTTTGLSRTVEMRPPTGAFRECLRRLESRGLVERNEDREWVAS